MVVTVSVVRLRKHASEAEAEDSEGGHNLILFHLCQKQRVADGCKNGSIQIQTERKPRSRGFLGKQANLKLPFCDCLKG